MERWIFLVVLLFPATGLVQRGCGVSSVFAFLVTGSVLVWGLSLLRKRQEDFEEVTDRYFYIIVAVVFSILIVSFFLIYPEVNSQVPGQGSDNDDAINQGVSELLRGNYPYAELTYLGNQITPLPGALLLAIPFVLIGNGALQNFFWLIIYFLLVKRILGNNDTLMLMAMILVLCPAVLYSLVTGSDYIANSIYILVFSVALYYFEISDRKKSLLSYIPLILLGIGLASRPNFLFILFPLMVLIANISDYKQAAVKILIICAVFALVTLPFYIYAPDSFAPLHVTYKLSQFDSVLPNAEVIIPILTLLLAAALSFFQKASLKNFLQNATVILMFPVLSVFVLSSIHKGGLDFSNSGYGLFFLFPGVIGFWKEKGRR